MGSVNYEISDIFNYTYTGPTTLVTGVTAGAAEVSTINTTGGFAGIVGGEYFIIYTANDATKYYVWFDVTGSNTDPAIPGATGIEVDWTVDSVTTDGTLAIAIGARLDAVDPIFGTPLVVGNLVTVTLTTVGHTTDINATTATHLPPTGIAVAVTTQGLDAAVANTGLLYRDVANDNEVRILGPGTVGQVLQVTATNIIGWANAAEASTNTQFLVQPAVAQTLISTPITTHTDVVWGTEIIDPGANFATNTYTAPFAGTYYFACDLQWATAGKENKGQRRIVFREGAPGSADLLVITEQPNADKTIEFWQRGMIIVLAAASDTFLLQASQDSGKNQLIGTGSRFMGWRIAAV